jgi:GGDEF domain-containing protein
VISLKKLLLTNDKTALDSSLMRIALLFLETAALHAVELSETNRAAYQVEMRCLRERFEQTSDAPAALILAGEAVRSMESHNRDIEKYIMGLRSENRAIVHMMMESLIKVCANADSSKQNLRHIEKQLEKASQVDDVRSIKKELAQCLETICETVSRHNALTQQITSEVTGQIKGCQSGANLLELDDRVTGLPGLNHAIEAITELCTAGKCPYVVIIFLKNMEIINQRFGFATGDKILVMFSQHLAQQLGNSDQLFRWRGPCFVAVLDRVGSAEDVREEARRLGAVNLEHSVESDGRSMLFRLTTTSAFIPIVTIADAFGAAKNIDAFAAAQIHAKAAIHHN